MSSRKVMKAGYVLKFTSTYDALNSVLTVVTASAHNLVNGDLVTLTFPVVPQEFVNVAVTVVDTTTFTIAVPNHTVSQGEVHIDFFRTTGARVITMPRSVGASCVVQSVATAAAGYTPSVSLDGINWIALTAVTHSAAGTTSFTIEPNWAYLQINVTSVSGSLTVLYSA